MDTTVQNRTYWDIMGHYDTQPCILWDAMEQNVIQGDIIGDITGHRHTMLLTWLGLPGMGVVRGTWGKAKRTQSVLRRGSSEGGGEKKTQEEAADYLVPWNVNIPHLSGGGKNSISCVWRFVMTQQRWGKWLSGVRLHIPAPFLGNFFHPGAVPPLTLSLWSWQMDLCISSSHDLSRPILTSFQFAKAPHYWKPDQKPNKAARQNTI